MPVMRDYVSGVGLDYVPWGGLPAMESTDSVSLAVTFAGPISSSLFIFFFFSFYFFFFYIRILYHLIASQKRELDDPHSTLLY